MFRGINNGKGITTNILRTVAAVMGLTMAWLSGPQLAFAKPTPKPRPVSILKQGLTQTPDATLRKKIAARQAAERNNPKLDSRPLTDKEMKSITGRGPYRNAYFAGTMPWQRTLRDVNLTNGNLFKSFTDIQIAPGRGAGLLFQRTYNSNDDREGPFGIGWTHAYDIRVEDMATPEIDPNTGNEYVPRTDFFGGKHKYQRDADGLYTPPSYMFDEMDSKYDEFLVNGPPEVLEDTQKGMDGTIKHFVSGGTDADGSPSRVRVCDYIEDRFGNRTTLDYALTVTFPDGRTEKKLTKVTDPVGRELNFTWLNMGTTGAPKWRITEVLGPTGTYRVTYDYNVDKNLSAVHLDPDGLNRITTFGYTSVSGFAGTETGLLSSITDPLGHVVTYTYAIPGVNPTGTVWVTGVTEPAGVDSSGVPRTLTWMVNPLSSVITVYGYGGSPSWPQMGGFHVRDASFRTIYHQLLSNGSGYEIYTTEYDTSNNVIRARWFHPYPDDRETQATYGPHGNVLTQWTTGFSATTTTEYYDASKYFQKKKVTDPLGRVTEFDYFTSSDPIVGNRGNVKWLRNARYATTGKQFEYGYNQYGQMVWEKNLSDIVTTFAHGDTWGNLTQVIKDPDNPSISYVGLKRTTTMLYDVAGRLLGATDSNGQSNSFTYNNLGQPLSAVFPTSLQGVTGESVSYSYGANGRTESVVDGRGTTSITYEAGSDRVASLTDPVTGTISYKYLISGERESTTLPGGGTVSYEYGAASLPKDDANNLTRLLSRIVDDNGRIVDIYAPGGVPRSMRFNQTFSGTTLVSYCETTYLYDRNFYNDTHLWLATQQTIFRNVVANTTQVLARNQYTYNDAGQRTHNQITDHLSNVRTEQYGYDELYRLTGVNYGDGQIQGYTFDDRGNRLTKTDNVTGNESYTYDAANILLTRTVGGITGNYSNDPNGNMVSGGGRTSTWDSLNRLRQCVTSNGTSAFTYGNDGLRRRSVFTPSGGGTTTTTDFALDGANTIREFVGGSVSATYLAGPSGPMYRRPSTVADVRWYVFDGLGSVVAEVAVNGTVTAAKKHDAYGLNRGISGTPASKHGFVGRLGHTTEDESGLIYMRARHYAPELGRFISQDTKHDGGNWFAYCANDPINSVDETGKAKVGIGEFIGYNLFFIAGATLTAIAVMIIFLESVERASGYAPTNGAGAAYLAATAAVFCFSMAFIGAGHVKGFGMYDYAVGGVGTLAGAAGLYEIISIVKNAEALANIPIGNTQALVAATLAYGLMVCGGVMAADAAFAEGI